MGHFTWWGSKGTDGDVLRCRPKEPASGSSPRPLPKSLVPLLKGASHFPGSEVVTWQQFGIVIIFATNEKKWSSGKFKNVPEVSVATGGFEPKDYTTLFTCRHGFEVDKKLGEGLCLQIWSRTERRDDSSKPEYFVFLLHLLCLNMKYKRNEIRTKNISPLYPQHTKTLTPPYPGTPTHMKYPCLTMQFNLSKRCTHYICTEEKRQETLFSTEMMNFM